MLAREGRSRLPTRCGGVYQTSTEQDVPQKNDEDQPAAVQAEMDIREINKNRGSL